MSCIFIDSNNVEVGYCVCYWYVPLWHDCCFSISRLCW